MGRTRGLRGAWLALMVLQLALPGWSAVADAYELVPQPRSVHLESDACVPAHPEDCALCSFLQTPADPAAQVVTPPPLGARHASVRAEQCTRPLGAIGAAPLPRGPPARS